MISMIESKRGLVPSVGERTWAAGEVKAHQA